MKLDNRLNAVASNAMSQMLSEPAVTKNMSSELLDKVRNIGAGLVVAVLAFSSTGLAHADTTAKILNTTIGMGAIAGIMNSGTVPDDIPRDCVVDGKSGLPVALGTAVGALLGKQVGGGTGKHIAIAAGGLIGGTTANAIQDSSIREECLRQNAAYQQRILSVSENSGRLKKVSAQEVYENTPSAQYNRNGSFAIADSITGNTPTAQHPAMLGNNTQAQPVQQAQGGQVFRNAKGEVYQAGGNTMIVPTSEKNPEQILNRNYNMESDYPNPMPEQNVAVKYPTKVVANVPQNTILYAFQVGGRKGPITYVTAKDSPGISSMTGQLGTKDVASHPRLQTKMDELNNRMIESYAGLERASVDYLTSSRGVRIDNIGKLNKDLNKQYVRERVKVVDTAMTKFSEARGEFMQLADVAALEGYKLDRYQQAIQFLDDGPLVNRLYQRKNVARFTKFDR